MTEPVPPNESAKANEAAARLVEIVKALALELHPGLPGLAGAHLDSVLDRDLGYDSLGRMELLLRIERNFNARLPEQIVASAATPRDLLRAILNAEPPQAATISLERASAEQGAAVAAPPTAQTLIDVLEWHAATHPDRRHIQFYEDDRDGPNMTYRQLRDGALRVAAGLAELDLRPKETVLIMLPTSQEYFLSFFGILLAGGTPVPIYPPARPKQIEDHLRRHAGIANNCLAGIMITVPEAKGLALLFKAHVPSLREIATVAELEAEPLKGFAPPAVGGDAIAFLQYTSGSTGDPKGVVLTHDNLLANVRAVGQAMNVTPDDVCVSWLPLYHDMGLIGAWFGSLYHAVPLVVMSPLTFLARPQRWLKAIHRYRGTISAAPNFAYELAVRRFDDKEMADLDLRSWRCALNGAEAVNPETLERFIERFAPHGFRREAMMPVYGLAECSVGLAVPPLDRGPLVDRIRREPFVTEGNAVPATSDDAIPLAFPACGQPLPGHQIRIVDTAGRELPERRQGRLQFLGPSATRGYFRNPEATAKLFDGTWLESGDLAYVAGGDVYITGRVKDMIIRAGRNIYPAEIEAAVGMVDGVIKGNVAVFGSTDPATGTERLVVLAETRRTDPASRDTLKAEIGAAVTDLAGTPPDDVALAPPATVLKTSSGKVRRAACKSLYERGLIGRPRAAAWWLLTRLALESIGPSVKRGLNHVGQFLYAGYVYAVVGIVATVAWLAVVALPVPSWRWPTARAATRILLAATGIRLTVEGREHLPSTDRPFILVSNHMSYIDGAILMAALGRPIGFVAKAELASQFVPRLFLGRIGTEFIERFDRQRSIDDARRLGRRTGGRHPLLFFAEGTFQRMPGLLPFRMGAFTAAADARVPIVPVAILGTRYILRSDSWFPRHGSVTVAIGTPIEPPSAESDAWSSALKLRDATRQHMLRHTGEPDLGREKPPL
ncbi:MAG: acyl-phosphate glycerol 3-phosphate acyltransferase [Rhodospirillales bacterium]|nr:acyl-phosphate glycerol 3-phosphate acyltransferase [Rhodospirillales bacterium]